MTSGISIIIPAYNEADYIGACLDALMNQKIAPTRPVQLIVAANGCTDETVAIAGSYKDRAQARGWYFEILDIPEGGKPNALNAADQVAKGAMRVYLDADVICSTNLIEQITTALDQSEPAYASGRLVIAPAKSWVTRRFADLWSRLPFMTESVPGAGLFAVNGAGRKRWSTFPKIISDDGYVRLLFRPDERIGVEATYLWPMVEGFRALVQVRRRQDAGMAEIAEKYPALLGNDPKPPVPHLRLFLNAPVSYLVYVGVMLSVRVGMGARTQGWTRGR